MRFNLLDPKVIPKLFDSLKAEIDDIKNIDGGIVSKLKGFLTYFECTWIKNSVWKISEWNVYDLRIRTNNDVEGKAAIIKHYTHFYKRHEH